MFAWNDPFQSADYEKQIQENSMGKKSELVRGYGLAMSIGAMMDEIRRAQNVTEDEFHVLGTPEGRPHLEKMIMGLKASAPEIPKPVYLRQLYVGEEITLDPADGSRTIAQASDVFDGYIDPNFTNWNLDAPAQPTEPMNVRVGEMIADGTFGKIYGSLGHSYDRLCHTQHQVVNFCAKHKDKLRQDGYGTFFLFKRGDEFFVAVVRVSSDGPLNAGVRRFSLGHVWNAGCRRRFVLPQLEPLAASVS